MNGADRLCDGLLAHGVDVCFANPGTSEMHFVAALDRKPAMCCILGLFEGVVTGAADGYGRMANRPAVTLLHTGPGLANGLANLHNARRARTPLINVVGDHASYHLKFDAPLTSDIESLARPMSHWVHRIAGPSDVEAGVTAAWIAAMTSPGVATLILPADAAWGDAAAKPAGNTKLPALGRVKAPDVRAVAEALRKAPPGRAGVLLGGRALRADCVAVADRLRGAGIRVFGEMLMARMERGGERGHVERIPYPVDMALDLLRDIDVLALVGANAPVAFFAYPGKPGALTSERCEIVSLAAQNDDVKYALEALANELGAKARPSHKRGALPSEPTQGVLTDEALTLIVANLLPEGAIVVDEAATSMRGFFQVSKDCPAHDYLMVCTGGAIGNGIPAAAGAAVACPDRKVIALQADGSGMYTVQGLWTLARENLDVTIIVFSNHAYAILHAEMHNVGVNHFGRNARRMLNLDEPALDWAGIARGMGVEAGRAQTCEEFAKLLKGALGRRGPFLIEAVV
jgi:acetolactate synthase I/II/III large subunit